MFTVSAPDLSVSCGFFFALKLFVLLLMVRSVEWATTSTMRATAGTGWHGCEAAKSGSEDAKSGNGGCWLVCEAAKSGSVCGWLSCEAAKSGNGVCWLGCEAAKSGWGAGNGRKMDALIIEEGVVDGVAPVAIGGGVVDGVALVAICPCEAAKSGRIFTSISSGGIEYYVFSRVVGDCAFSSCQACPGLVLLWHGDDLQQVFMRDQFLLVLRG